MAKYGVNKVIMLGNLGTDPEVRYLDQGIAVANFRIATTERFRNAQGNSDDRTEWHNIVLWRGLAETAGKYLKKGSTVYIEGRLVNRSWDGQDGQKRYRTEIEADKMLMMDGRPDRDSGPNDYRNTAAPGGEGKVAEPGGKEYSPKLPEEDDDLPF